jgi:hypothetical protein
MKLQLGTPHALSKHIGNGNGAAMQSMGNDGAVSHPSHSGLEDADKARVSHIPTTTATKSDKKGRQQLLLHQASVRSRQPRMPGGSLPRMPPMVTLQHLIKSVSRSTRSWRDSAWIILARALCRQRTASFMTDLPSTRDGETNLSSTASNAQGSLKCASGFFYHS